MGPEALAALCVGLRFKLGILWVFYGCLLCLSSLAGIIISTVFRQLQNVVRSFLTLSVAQLGQDKTRLPVLFHNAMLDDVKSLRALTRREPATKARWFEIVLASDHLQLTNLRALFLLIATASLLAGCCTTPAQHQLTNVCEPKPKWHSIVMIPRTNTPAIHFYNRLNPIWWLGNADEPRPPEWYRPNARTRTFTWYLRNPFANFSKYVIGIEDKKSIRSGKYPDKIGNPHGGWNFAVSRRHILILPFIDFKHGRFEFYSGWRQRGNFGMKLNLWQRLPNPHPKDKSAIPPADRPLSADNKESPPDAKPGPSP